MATPNAMWITIEKISCMSQKSLYKRGPPTVKKFLYVILFMFAVPRHLPATRSITTDTQLEPSEINTELTYMNVPCKFYQQNHELMTFLRDCAVVVLITGHFNVPKDVQSVCVICLWQLHRVNGDVCVRWNVWKRNDSKRHTNRGPRR